MTIKNKDKKVNVLFQRRLTEWMPLKEVKPFTEPFYRHHGRKAYGRHFVIKKRGRRREYAIYIREENKLKRVEDKELVAECVKMPFELQSWLNNPYKMLFNELRKQYIS